MEFLSLPSRLDVLDDIGRFVLTAAEQAGIEKKRAYRLRLAVDEIATNIISYGYERAGISGNIDITAAATDDALTIILEDSAPPFNPIDHPEPEDLESPLEERQIGGLGVFLAIRNVDVFEYEHVGGRNRNIFVVKRNAGQAT